LGKIDDVLKTKQIFDERKVLYKGHYYRLAFVPRQTQRISVRDHNIVLPNYTKINLKQVVKDWMSKETGKLVEKRLKHLGRRLKLTAHGFSVRDTRKWAYCTRDKRLVFNPQLIALPTRLSDYVMIRELARLRGSGRPKKFKDSLASLVPDFRERELLLKRFIIE
jgi:predicted metal-dependent hydrolase